MSNLPGEPDPQPGDGSEPPAFPPVSPPAAPSGSDAAPSDDRTAPSGADDAPSDDRTAPSGGDDRAPVAPSGIGRASALLASGTIVSRVLGFAKAIVLAAAVGQVASEAGSAFGVANQLPNNIYALVAGGVLGAVLVPQIVRASLHDDGGRRYINKIVTLGVTAFVAIALLATIAAPLFITLYARPAVDGERGFTPEGLALATAFAYWCLPQVLFYAIYSLLGEVLNARRAFGAFSWAPVVNNVVAIAGLAAFFLLFGGKVENSGTETWDPGRIALLAGSATLGVAAQALVLVLFWRRAGLTFRPDFRWRGVGLGRTGRAAGWTFGMILVTQLAGIVQSQVASIAATDGVSVLALQNSWLIFMLPHSVIAVSIGIAYFTRMSSHASIADHTALRADVSASLRTIGLLITFASVALVVVAFPFARIFENGGFDNVTQMALVIIAFVIGLVPFSAVFVLQRVFYALEDTRTPFFVETAKAGTFVVGAGLASLAASQWVGVGIALATTAACVLQTALTFLLLRRRLGPIGGMLLLRRHVQYLLAGLVSAAVGLGILVVLGGLRADGFAQSGIGAAFTSIVGIGAGMGAVYFGILLLMRISEVDAALSTITRRLGRRR